MTTTVGVERQRITGFGRLDLDLRQASDLVSVGALPQRKAMGHSSRRLQPQREHLGLSTARPRALARVPLGRGRARRLL